MRDTDPPPLPPIDPPKDPMYEIRSRIIRVPGGLWDATQVIYTGHDYLREMRIAAWSRPPGDPDWPWILLVYRRHDGAEKGAALAWTATWCAYDRRLLRPVRDPEPANVMLSAFLEEVGGWPRFIPPARNIPRADERPHL